ncbi:Deoxyguanosinetriphosphate triphosphohydrolase-like protein [Geodia barretti]|uniref:Deoxyguanosinetriphosphate triphosphohydrolase-like protein n=1 Tax=Geodia barretti TaxID=519541 RepID=A0AA35RC60_GEOBA|nr:Deoxyguanosinetriphosphate triphosphohydrolase-like protein [Geodia barretti]
MQKAFGNSVTQSGTSLKTPSRLPGIRIRLEEREEHLSPYAAKSSRSAGRAIPETPSDVRTEYQRDRDRIIHSKAFRRLKHKTQVFIAPLGDHYVTRLTHTLEVSQIARTIARALNLNEDLAEAIALGHDLGHTPFGHIGEDELDKILPDGYRHSQQSLNVVERIEREGTGPQPHMGTQIVRISDAVAYINHDLADAFRAGILSDEDLPGSVAATLGTRHSQRIDTIVCDIIDHSYHVSGINDISGGANGANPEMPLTITMGDEVRTAFMELREFMFDTVYMPNDDSPLGNAARQIIRFLHQYFSERTSEIPPAKLHWEDITRRSRTDDEVVVDYVSGMTDLYAIRIAEKLSPGIAKVFSERLL